MGMTDEQRAKRDADIAALVAATNPAAPLAGHGRGTTHVDRSRTDALELRGIPAVGYGVAGVIPGTRPGDPAQLLDQAGRDILRANLTRRHYRPGDAP